MGIALLAATVAWIGLVVLLGSRGYLNSRIVALPLASILGLYVAFSAAALRSTVSDRVSYLEVFSVVDGLRWPTQLEGYSLEPAFVGFLWLLSRASGPQSSIVFFVVAVLLSLGYLISAHVLLPPWGALGAWFMLICTGLLVSYSGIALRQGMALAFMMPGVALLVRRKSRSDIVLALVFLVIASSMHWSALAMSAVALLAQTRIGSMRIMLAAWVTAALLFVTGWNGALFSGFQSLVPELDTYTNVRMVDHYGGGVNRLDFLAVNAVAVAGSLLVVMRGRDDPAVLRYRGLLKGYLGVSIIFLLFGFIAFSDRLAAYGWFLAPLLVWYPLSVMVGFHQWRGPVFAVTLGVGLLFGALGAIAP